MGADCREGPQGSASVMTDAVASIFGTLRRAGLDICADDLLDALWLAGRLPPARWQEQAAPEAGGVSPPPNESRPEAPAKSSPPSPPSSMRPVSSAGRTGA